MTTYDPILKSSPEITRTKGDTDERSIREKFSGLIASQAGKVAEELPKPKRVVDPKAIARVRAWGRCQRCEKSKRTNKKVRLHVAHIKSRSAGGGDTDDNLVLLCSVCHQNSHQIGNPSREEMIFMAEDRARRQRVALSAFAAEKLVREQTEEGKP